MLLKRCTKNLFQMMYLVPRLWAEVFHVSASGTGTVKWQQVSEDLVPVNITCIQDTPECVFHITAYNSQVDKILDVRLVQPGTVVIDVYHDNVSCFKRVFLENRRQHSYLPCFLSLSLSLSLSFSLSLSLSIHLPLYSSFLIPELYKF